MKTKHEIAWLLRNLAKDIGALKGINTLAIDRDLNDYIARLNTLARDTEHLPPTRLHS